MSTLSTTAPRIGQVLEAHRRWLEKKPGGHRANLAGCVLTDINREVANLSQAILASVNFLDSKLTGANLSGADLSGADLRNVSAVGADFSHAELTNARFNFAWLAECNFRKPALAILISRRRTCGKPEFATRT